MKPPETDTWPRAEFLAARRRQIDYTRAYPNIPPGWEGCEIEVMDPGDEIICDYCNALIEDDLIHLRRYGKMVACEDCDRLNKP